MTTPIDSWVASWLCVHRAMPQGDWIIRGQDAERVGAVFWCKPMLEADNDNKRVT